MGLVLDCAEPERLAAFWAPALGYVSLGDAGAYTVLVPEGRPGPKLLLQRVPEPKTTKNRMHLDIGTTWIVMADPEGNEFCVCDGGAGSAHH